MITTPSHENLTSFDASFRADWRLWPQEIRAEYLARQRELALRKLYSSFGATALDHQLPPLLARNGETWTTWLLIGGRGAGKTYAGAQWVKALVASHPRRAKKPVPRIALVGETEHDVREVMIEGVSGLLAAHAHGERPDWQPSRRRLTWKNGAVAHAFSAEEPESLRGPQFSAYGVNSGPSRAAKVLHRILGLPDNVRMSDSVIAAARSGTARDLIVRLCEERLGFLRSLKTWPVFGAGWSRRVREVKSAALIMANHALPNRDTPVIPPPPDIPSPSISPERDIAPPLTKTGAGIIAAILSLLAAFRKRK